MTFCWTDSRISMPVSHSTSDVVSSELKHTELYFHQPAGDGLPSAARCCWLLFLQGWLVGSFFTSPAPFLQSLFLVCQPTACTDRCRTLHFTLLYFLTFMLTHFSSPSVPCGVHCWWLASTWTLCRSADDRALSPIFQTVFNPPHCPFI